MTDRYRHPDSRRAHAKRARGMRAARMRVLACVACACFAAVAASSPQTRTHVSGLPHAVARPSLSPALAKPGFAINVAQASTTGSCDVLHAVKVDFSITNNGGPMTGPYGKQVALAVQEIGGPGLNGSWELPNLKHGQTWRGSLPLALGIPDLARLPGMHRLSVYIRPLQGVSAHDYVLPKPLQIMLNVPAGHCQIKHVLPPARMHLKPVPRTSTPRPGTSSSQPGLRASAARYPVATDALGKAYTTPTEMN